MDRKVIFIPHYKGAFAALFHLAMYVKRNKVGIPHFVLYFSDDSNAKQILKDNGIEFSVYRIKWFMKIPLVGQVIKLIFDLIYSARLVERLSAVQAMVCSVETSQLEYALIAVLGKRNINTIVLQWAQTVPRRYYLSVGNGKNRNVLSAAKESLKNFIKPVVEKIFRVKYAESYGDGNAKYFAVMSSYYYEMFRKQGVSEKKLVVTGHPEFDRLYDLSLEMKNPNYKRTTLGGFGLDGSKPLWIFAREAIAYFKLVAEEKDKEDVCKVLEILSEYHPRVQIVLKLHPRDCEDYYAFVSVKFPHVIIIHECDLHQLIAACDLYVSQISSTMMWAIALDKPVISYDFNSQPEWHYFRDKEGIIKADSPEDLAGIVKTIQENEMTPKNYQNCQLAREKYMTFDGKSNERIAELITRENK